MVRLLCQRSSGVPMQQVLHEGHSGAQTLQHSVQVAGVARVVQSAHSQHARRRQQAIPGLPPGRARGHRERERGLLESPAVSLHTALYHVFTEHSHLAHLQEFRVSI